MKPEPSASRETSTHLVGPLMVQVFLPKSSGAQRVGAMVPEKVYELPADEAIRLVDIKGFRYASETDAQLAATHIEQRNAAAFAQAEVAAAAAGEGGGATTNEVQE